MRYAARLARLERLVGKGAGNCPYCRLHRRHTWPGPDKPSPNPRLPRRVVQYKCHVCGDVERVDLSACSDGSGELLRLFFEAGLEDFYRDERAWAAREWVGAGVAAEKAREAQRRTNAGEQPPGLLARRPPQRKDGPEKKLYDKLRAELRAYTNRAHARLEARYGKDPFPDLAARLAAVTHVDREHLYADFKLRVPVWEMIQLQREEAAWLRRAEIERHVLGGILAETQERIDDCERRALEMIGEARRRHEESEESERLRRELAERTRREREEGEQAITPPAPAAAADESPAAVLQRVYRKLAQFDPAFLPLIDTPDPIAPDTGPDDDRASRAREGAQSDPEAPAAPAVVWPRAEIEQLQRSADKLLSPPAAAPAGPPRRYRTTDEPRRPWERRAKY